MRSAPLLGGLDGVAEPTPDGQVPQRSATTPEQKAILAALDLPEPPRFFDFTLPDND